MLICKNCNSLHEIEDHDFFSRLPKAYYFCEICGDWKKCRKINQPKSILGLSISETESAIRYAETRGWKRSKKE